MLWSEKGHAVLIDGGRSLVQVNKSKHKIQKVVLSLKHCNLGIFVNSIRRIFSVCKSI